MEIMGSAIRVRHSESRFWRSTGWSTSWQINVGSRNPEIVITLRSCIGGSCRVGRFGLLAPPFAFSPAFDFVLGIQIAIGRFVGSRPIMVAAMVQRTIIIFLMTRSWSILAFALPLSKDLSKGLSKDLSKPFFRLEEATLDEAYCCGWWERSLPNRRPSEAIKYL